ncbi:MAG: universal stress protein [Bacteroidota bacterium]
MKKILVPTDFSFCADNAMNIAIGFAKKMNAEIHLLHFTSIPVDWLNLRDRKKMYPDVTERINECRQLLKQKVEDCKQKGIEAAYYIEYNESYQNILDHTTAHLINIVVMGSHGTSGVKGILMGSNAQKVVRLSSVPLLVVKPETTELLPESITIVSDFPWEDHEPGHKDAFEKIVRLSKELNFPIQLLFVNTPGGFTTSKELNYRIVPYLESAALKEEPFVINAANLEEGISVFLESHPNTIVGMITHGETGFNRIIRGSQVESIVNHLKSPILTIKMT